MTTDFRTLLRRPADSIKKPKPLPAGTYHGVISRFEFLESKEKKTPYVRFHLTIHSPGEDIDPATLEGIELGKKNLRKDFYLTDDALYRLTEFLNSLGISSTGRFLDEMVPDAVSQPVIISVTQRSSQDGSEIYNDVDNVKGQA